MPYVKHAQTEPVIDRLLSERWSPYAFADRDVADEDLLALLEAARWAASSYNEQPWRYILARRRDAAAFAKLLSCLVEPNQAWARHVPVLMIGVAMTKFARNAKPNKAAHHDLGLASANLSTEATARGLCVHQMIGIVPERVRELYALPEEAEPLTGLAIGYLGDPATLPDGLRERDLAPRTRNAVSAFAFEGAWETPAVFRCA
jgi:nitroreductase